MRIGEFEFRHDLCMFNVNEMIDLFLIERNKGKVLTN